MFRRTQAAATLCLAVSGCTVPATPTAEIMAITLCVTNTNPEMLVFRHVTVDLDRAGAAIAAGLSNRPLRLSAHSSTRVPFTVQMTAHHLDRQRPPIAAEGTARYRLQGLVALAGTPELTIPYSRSGDLDVAEAADRVGASSDAPSSRCVPSDLPVPF